MRLRCAVDLRSPIAKRALFAAAIAVSPAVVALAATADARADDAIAAVARASVSALSSAPASSGPPSPAASSSSSSTTFSPPADSAKPKTAFDLRHVFDLAACIAAADAHNAQIRMSMDRLLQADAQLDEIEWTPWGQFSVSGGIAAVPQLEGTAVYSPNSQISLSSHEGPAFSVGVSGVLPLYTFGKISSSRAMGRSAVEIAAQDVEKFRLAVHHDVRRAYFGLLLAHDARYLLRLAAEKLDHAIKHADENVDADEGDLLKMKTYRAEIIARTSETDRGERIASSSLKFLIGADAPVDVPDEPIAPPRKPLLDDVVYLMAAKTHRPELKQVKTGVEARTHQVEFARAKMFPDIGLGLSFSYATSPILQQQTNPFVYNPSNYLLYGAGIVFRWNFDFMAGAARVRYAEAQLQEVEDQQIYALGGVGVEVETAFANAKDASDRVKAYGEAEQLAKRWVASVSAAISIGTKEDKDIVDPLRAFLTNRFNHLQAIYDLDIAASSLAVSTGDESLAEY